jgi:hypothetical protein
MSVSAGDEAVPWKVHPVPAAGAGRIVKMPLSRYEQRVLDEIETGIKADYPAFAAKLNLETADLYRRRQTVLAHGCLWLGLFMTLTGFGLVHDVLATGVLLILYGAGTLIFALVRMLQLRPSESVGQQRIRRSRGRGGAADLD